MQLSFLNSEHANKDIISLEGGFFSFTCINIGNSRTKHQFLQISPDISYEQFFTTIQPILGLTNSTSYDVTIDGTTYTKAAIVEAGSLKILNLKENDLLIISPDIPLVLQEIDDDDRMNLIKSIHIPSSATQLRFEISTSRDGMGLYQQLRRLLAGRTAQEIERIGRQMDRTYPGLLSVYQRRPNDKWAFMIAYRNSVMKMEDEQKRKGHVQVQKIMEQRAEAQRLEENFNKAYHETPEAIIPVDMLYIKIQLNGVEGHAFIDTGAAKTLISRDYVDRCGLSDLVNKENPMQFRGIGGNQDSEGTIWLCDMTIESHQLPVTLHVVPNGAAAHEVLIGLDILLRHKCIINLGERTLTWNDEVTTKFLTPEESGAYSQKEREAMRNRELREAGILPAEDEPMETEQK